MSDHIEMQERLLCLFYKLAETDSPDKKINAQISATSYLIAHYNRQQLGNEPL